MLFMAFGVLGIVYLSHKTMSSLIYSIYFPHEREPASASVTMWDNLGAALAYAVSAHICNRTYIAFMLSLGGVGTLFYLFTERTYTKQSKQRLTQNR